MFDEMTLKIRLDDGLHCEHVISVLALQECTRGEIVFYQSTAAAKFDGIHATLVGNKLNIRLNVGKLWSKWANGVLDNSGLVSMDDSVATIMALMDMLQVDPQNVVSDKFAVGISMRMKKSPQDYISQMVSIGEAGKETFVDALYEKDRQRTTTKVKTVKKVLKVYDKTHEAESKGREVAPNILRCETVYRRQGMHLDKLIDPRNLVRLQTAFWRDWNAAVFHQTIRGDKGTKASQLEKATAIMTEGLGEYRSRMRSAYIDRGITKKTWETVRVFCDQWKNVYSCHFFAVPGELENEFRTTLKDNYDRVIFRK